MISDAVKKQINERLSKTLKDKVEVKVYVKPGGSKLVLPKQYDCPTCPHAIELAEDLKTCVPEALGIEIVNVMETPWVPDSDGDVPLFAIQKPGEQARIFYKGLPVGYEFEPFLANIEKVSNGDSGLSAESVQSLSKLDKDIEIMVFVTPT